MLYVCKKCGRKFTNAGAKATHEKGCNGILKKQYSEEELIYKCECGKKFHSRNSLNSHTRFCNQYIKTVKICKYKISENLYRCECGKEFNNSQSLNGHFGHCEEHCKTLGKETSHHHKGSMCWEKLTDEQVKEIHAKSTNTFLEKIYNGEIVPTWKGKCLPDETKQKIRISAAKYVHNKGGACYSKTACNYMNELNKMYNWNLQHAENGGEIIINGYFLDGYDKDLNIVFEYDEPKHYKDVNNNILKEKDIKRQNEIISLLNCSFYRYNEKIQKLYKVN